jgi:hypothetical protein
VLTWIVRTLAKVRRSAQRWLCVASAARVVLGGNLSIAGTSRSVGVAAIYNRRAHLNNIRESLDAWVRRLTLISS